MTHARHHAFSLAEVIIGLTVTAVIGAAVAGMLYTTGRATENRRDLRQALIAAHALQQRLSACVNAARAFLAADAEQTVLWRSDPDANRAVNLGELGLIEYDDAAGEVRTYEVVWPQGWSQAQIDAANVVYPADADFLAAAIQAKAGGLLVPSVLSRKVTAGAIALDNATPQAARLATLRLTLTEGDLDYPLVMAAALRAPQAPE